MQKDSPPIMIPFSNYTYRCSISMQLFEVRGHAQTTLPLVRFLLASSSVMSARLLESTPILSMTLVSSLKSTAFVGTCSARMSAFLSLYRKPPIFSLTSTDVQFGELEFAESE